MLINVALLILFTVGMISGLGTIPFIPRKLANGSSLCAVSPSMSLRFDDIPSGVSFDAPGMVRCAYSCVTSKVNRNCTGFNYATDNEQCQFFNKFERERLFAINARSCTFPFTYNNQLLYQCTLNSSNTCDVGCFAGNRIWASCQPENIDYRAQYSSSEMFMPSDPNVAVPVLSINSWITIQNKVLNGQTTFNQSWNAYRNGFGSASLTDNYWIGNEFIYRMTTNAVYSLRIEIQRLLSPTDHLIWQSAEYSTFSLGPESSKYNLRVSGFTGDTVDALMAAARDDWTSNGKLFSTVDADTDNNLGNCASNYGGGWWYGWCSSSALNVDGYAFWSVAGLPINDVTSSHMLMKMIN